MVQRHRPIFDRIQLIRDWLRAHHYAASILTNSDFHHSEIAAPYFRIMHWASGFRGSAGVLVVTEQYAGLWTDSRYYLQAAQELADGPITLFRSGMRDTPHYTDWLGNLLPADARIACDGARMTAAHARDIQTDTARYRLQLVRHDGLSESLYPDAPPLKHEAASLIGDEYAGESRKNKLSTLRAKMVHDGIDWHFIGALDEIAWLLNIRGSDIPHTPVVYCWLLVGLERGILCIDTAKLSAPVDEELMRDGIQCHPYEEIENHLANAIRTGNLWFDPKYTPWRFAQLMHEAIDRDEDGDGEHTRSGTRSIIERPNDTRMRKAIKNSVELGHIRTAMQLDGAALTRFFYRLEMEMRNSRLSEYDAVEILRACRAEHSAYRGDSFDAIIAYGAHGAIVHHTPTKSAELRPDSLLLVDSGGQYLYGTTDITRTIALGPPHPMMKRDFTMTLKAHIALATAIVPVGTTDTQLDTIAKEPMWRAGLNYRHGTGHGIGVFLNVHESPPSISSSPPDIPLAPHMVFSNEPGLYRQGEYGIRLENIVQVITCSGTPNFLEFDTLSLCYFDSQLIEHQLLTTQELDWLTAYHQKVYEAIAPSLSPPEREWLKGKMGNSVI